MDAGSLGFGLAFVAGIVSFLSPCILPIVPGYVGFVTGLSFDELQEAGGEGVRRRAAVHAALFVLGFTAVFLALGASATALGSLVRDALPLLQRVGGVIILLFGLFMLGILRLPALMRERRFHLGSRPTGKAGSVAAGIAFGAGWTPCIGPVLATLLLYAGLEETMLRGMLLLGTYAVGLGIPFFLSAVALNWFLAGAKHVRRWSRHIQRAAGVVLVVVGLLLITGEFARMTEYLSQFSPFIEIGA
jgi:cytochrome c-type biogenesis protein